MTQQLARNSFELKGKTFRRKLLEMFVARRIEDNFSKQKIMELYLNRIYFGGGLYGAEAASRGYFDKPAREMIAGGMRHARGPGQEPEQAFALERSGGLDARRAISSSAGCANSGSSTTRRCQARRPKRS